jgi:quercetin dioxygenase-like cupin family protein
MRRIASAFLLLAVVAPTAIAQSAAAHAAPPAPKWGPAPPVFPAGAQMEVMQGNPGANGLFTVRLRFPNGYRVAPHTHPTDEHITVISGTLQVGMGKTVDAKQMMTLHGGDFATAPANAPHYAQARGTTVVQVHAMGPFILTYVNPADMPKATASR